MIYNPYTFPRSPTGKTVLCYSTEEHLAVFTLGVTCIVFYGKHGGPIIDQ